MRYLFILYIFTFQITYGIADTGPPIQMAVWKDLQTYPAASAWDNKPTWYQEILPSEKRPLVYEDVLVYAERCYDWVAATEGDKFKTGTNRKLVAVLYDPTGPMLYASTIPRTGRLMEMKAAANEAPAWLAAKKSSKSPDPMLKRLHAEDAVFYNFETNDGTIKTGTFPYPEGMTLAIWGSENGQPPKEYYPCWPCAYLVSTLGVTYKNQNQVMVYPQQAGAPAPPETPDDSNDDAANAVCIAPENAGPAKRGNGGALIHANVRRNTTRFLNCTTTYTPTISLSPLPSNFTLPATVITPITDTYTGGNYTGGTSTASPIAAIPSCLLQKADPDQGILQACVCQGSVTLPLISAPSTAMASMSCAYTALPTGTATSEIITATPTLGPATTDTLRCQICTPVVNNEDTCTSIPGCSSQSARASVTAGSSAVHVGTLTGGALSTSISSALASICPPATSGTMTSCAPTAKVTLGGISYVENNGLHTNGELVVGVESSGYNVTSLRDAMINTIAVTAQQGAAGGNCYNASYEVDLTSKRAVDTWLWPFSRLTGRTNLPATTTKYESMLMCNTNWFATSNYYNVFWHTDDVTSPSAWLSADYAFHVPPQSHFACILTNLLLDAFAAIEPDFAVEDIELEGFIDFVCGDRPDE